MSRKIYKLDTPLKPLPVFKPNHILRVAAYARVSTNENDQKNSLEAQKDYYEKKITANPMWCLAGIYSDDGITGTSYMKREGFLQMIADCETGRIDMIITKSISRFARNTVDTLETIRKLKDRGIGVMFEKENVWTLDRKGEFVLTLLASLAQEEARNISENTAWGLRKRMADGKYQVVYSRFIGYDADFVVNPEQAKTVRFIYKHFLMGLSAYNIADQLTVAGIRTPAGCDKWSSNSVLSILSNEKYKGDALLQKTYRQDFLSKRPKKNNGELPQYYVSEGHTPIIEPALFDYVQQLLAGNKRPLGCGLVNGKLICGKCGATYMPKPIHSCDKNSHVLWQCRNRFRKEEPCHNRNIRDRDIEGFFAGAMKQLLDERPEVIRVCQDVLSHIIPVSRNTTVSEYLSAYSNSELATSLEEASLVVKGIIIAEDKITIIMPY